MTVWDAEILALVAATFLLAGFVKGVVGLGLPTVSLALLAATLGLKEAIALMLIPSFLTNAWQGISGGAIGPILRRLWPLLATACLGIWIGAALLARADTAWLSALLGMLLCIYAATSLAAPQIPPPGARERWLSPLAGAVNGILTGMTGSAVIPGVLYLQALGLPRDMLVQAMGILFSLSAAVLAVALARHRLLPPELLLLSVVALVPAFAGMALGQRVRRRLSETRFRKVFFGALLVLGAYIAATAAL